MKISHPQDRLLRQGNHQPRRAQKCAEGERVAARVLPRHEQVYGIRGQMVEEVWPVEGRGKLQSRLRWHTLPHKFRTTFHNACPATRRTGKGSVREAYCSW